MKTEILYTDLSSLNRRMAEIKTGQETLQALLDECKGLDLVKIKTMPELQLLIRHGMTYYKGRMQEVIPSPSFGAFKIKRHALADLLDIPSLDKLGDLVTASQVHENLIRFYSLEGNKIILNETEVEKETKSYSVVAETKEQLNFVAAYKKAATALQELQDSMQLVYGYSHLRRDQTFGKVFHFDNDKIEINSYFCSQYRFKKTF